MGAAASTTAQPKVTCPAKARSGGRCQLRAGFGTAHVGYGLCKFHGGSTRNAQVTAARELAAQLGAELDMEPQEALLVAVRRAAMFERYCAARVSQLTDAELVVTHEQRTSNEDGETVTTSTKAELNVWVREHARALDQLTRIAKTAIDAGVEERRVRLAEQLVGDIADALDLVLTRLGVRDHPDAPAAVRAALALVEGPKQLEKAAA